MSGSNLPPGVSESMIPGNRPEDLAEDAFWEEFGKKLEEEGFKSMEITGVVGNFVNIDDLWDSTDFVKLVQIARDMGYNRGYGEGSDDAMTHVASEQEMTYERHRDQFRAEQRNMVEAHAEGLHSDMPREFCPECEA